MDTIRIREVTPADAKELSEIYSYYVENTAISFEYEAPSEEEFRGRIESITKEYPYICAEKDGKILGYAYASKFRVRKAFMYCVELSIYIDRNVTKSGLGGALYEELEKRLKNAGIKNLYACISHCDEADEYLDNNSTEFHEHMGYKQNAIFHRCGYKFDRWYDVIWMEKLI